MYQTQEVQWRNTCREGKHKLQQKEHKNNEVSSNSLTKIASLKRTSSIRSQNGKELDDRPHTAKAYYMTKSADELATQAAPNLSTSTWSKNKRNDD